MTLTIDPHQIAQDLYHGQFCPMFIDGKDVPALSGEVLNVVDPASGRALATVPRVSRALAAVDVREKADLYSGM